ncbi:hypothetical protein C8R43DRAFT_224817 [Mycena crocata]|nr:hypothetical protein C8R43DRAFT_224817 [Mycena crocata]
MSRRTQFQATHTERQTIAVIRRMLRDPMNTDSCARTIQTGSTMLLINEPDLMTKDGRQTQLIRAIMYFLTCPRSEEDQRALVRKLNTCRCNMGDPVLARLHHGDKPSDRPFEQADCDVMLASLCSIISRALGHRRAGKLRAAQKETPAEEQPWPTCEEDIMPGGARSTVNSLLRWVTVPPYGYAVFAVLGSVASFWHPFAQEVFHTPQAFSLAADHLQLALDRYDSAKPLPTLLRNFQLPLAACGDEFLLELVILDVQTSVVGMGPILDKMRRITIAIEPILKNLGAPDNGFAWFGQFRTIMDHLDLHQGDASLTSPGPPRPPNPVSHRTFSRLVHIRNINQCRNLACKSRFGVTTVLCGKCGIVRYCGLRCQRPAYRASRLAHKPLCEAIYTLRSTLQLEDKAQWDSWVLRADETAYGMQERADRFHVLCNSKRVDEELLENITSGIWGLTEAKRVLRS